MIIQIYPHILYVFPFFPNNPLTWFCVISLGFTSSGCPTIVLRILTGSWRVASAALVIQRVYGRLSLQLQGSPSLGQNEAQNQPYGGFPTRIGPPRAIAPVIIHFERWDLFHCKSSIVWATPKFWETTIWIIRCSPSSNESNRDDPPGIKPWFNLCHLARFSQGSRNGGPATQWCHWHRDIFREVLIEICIMSLSGWW